MTIHGNSLRAKLFCVWLHLESRPDYTRYLSFDGRPTTTNTAVLCAEDCFVVATEMHNVFANSAVSTERTLSKAVCMARLVSRL